ncbi:MAG: hypothetical protein LC640_04285, partial [Frankia sp.]|nr:hypothetical protein [Frankia sp.]
RIGWLLVALGFCFGFGLACSSYGEIVLGQRVVDLPGAPYVLWAGSVMFVPAFALLILLVVYFPADRLPSRRWRLPAAGAVVVATLDMLAWAVRPQFKVLAGAVPVPNPFAVSGLGRAAETAISATSELLAVFGVVAAVNVVWRFVRSRGERRLQMKWFAFAVAAFPVMFAIAVTSEALIGQTISNRLVVVAFVLGFNGLAVAIAIAVLRYRLYDIDRVISRTVAYVAVTAIVVAPYLLIVSVVSQIASSDFGVAIGTLAAAAAFNPVRHRVQERVDRRFNRARYDATRTVDEFSSRLRDQVDLDDLTHDLLGVVARTVQPTHASLWLRGAGTA